MFNYPGTPVILDFEVRNALDILTTPATVVFWWRIDKGGAIQKADIPEETSTGIYRAVFTPGRGGTCFWRFSTTEPQVVSQGRFYVEDDDFDQGDGAWGDRVPQPDSQNALLLEDE